MTALPRWSVENPVMVGLLMLSIIVGGIYSGFTLVREMFPESRPNMIAITTPYPGATPLEVERGISERIEEAIKNIEFIEKVETTIAEGVSTVMVELTSDVTDLDAKVNEIKTAVDAIPRDEFPEEAEETQVIKFEPRLPVISVTVFGDKDERSLKAIGRRLRDEILLLPDVTNVEAGGIRKAELTVEVQPEKLIEYGTSLAQVTAAIRAANLDLPAGSLKTRAENVAVRTLGETDETRRIENTIVRMTPEGRAVRVADLGRVIDGFEDIDLTAHFNGKPCVDVTVYKTGDQDAVDIANKVKAYVAGKMRHDPPLTFADRLAQKMGRTPPALQIYRDAFNDPFPPDVQVEVHSNLASYIEGRLELLTRNAIAGLILVFMSLLLFLNWRVALWVMVGLVVSVCGAAICMKLLGESLNLISMFGLIVVLGLLVDDAIVVGENVFARVEMGEDPHAAAVKGAQEVAWPVVIAVLTTVGAFMPLLFIEGQIGDFFGVLPIIVMCALGMSLLESLALLPCHLAEWLKPSVPRHAVKTRGGVVGRARGLGHWFMHDFLGAWYEWVLRITTRHRYVAVAVLIALMMLTQGLVLGLDNTGKPAPGGRVPFVFIQKMDSETLMANLEMPVGTPASQTAAAMQNVEDVILDREQFPEVRNMFSLIGAQIQADEGGATASLRTHIAQGIIELTPVGERPPDSSSEKVIARLRAQLGVPPGVNSLKFTAMQGGPAGAEIEIEITGKNQQHLLVAAETLKARLAEYTGVFDIDDDFEDGRRELQVELLDSARPLGLTTQALATEIRGAFFGLEARTLQRDREDVDIRVRYPADRRINLHEVEHMRIVTPLGAVAPMSEIAEIRDSRGFSSLRRVNQRRAVTVSADVDQAQTTADLVLADLAGAIEELRAAYPGVRIDFAGRKLESRKSLGSLRRDFFIALGIIYVMLAWLFRSYLQPFVVLAAVPFGLIGAVSGHWFMGWVGNTFLGETGPFPLTVLSVIGLVALSGIVVNDSLVMVDFINREIAKGMPAFDAVIQAGRRRLRAILLTSVTTILGLAPLMLERSFQAKFLIPMAVSISFGLMFATLLTLLMIPAFYLILDDVVRAVRRMLGRDASNLTPTPAAVAP